MNRDASEHVSPLTQTKCLLTTSKKQSYMATLKKHQSLEEKGHFVCDKCFYQFAHNQPNAAEQLTKQVDSVKSLYDRKLISEDQYHELLKLLISVYIGKRVTNTVTSKLDVIFRESLSPQKLLAFY